MKILILSFYYSPDLCPGSFRCTALVEELKRLAKPHYEIEIITTVPNRYASYDVQAPKLEFNNGVTINRILLPSHKSGMIDQAKAFIYFALEVRKLIKKKNYNLVFATSSRLMTATLGAVIAKRKKAKLYLDIRDIFLETLSDILPIRYVRFILAFFIRLEKFTFKQANHINLISKGFTSYVQPKYPGISLSWYTNGIDEEFLKQNYVRSTRQSNQPLTILYAGNIGEGQGLHRIVPLLAHALKEKIQFKIIGDGGRRKQLEEALVNYNNVVLIPPVQRQLLLYEYQKADILFLHLNDYAAFLKVLPSKIFEYAALGKPIWAGVAGFAAKFIRQEVENATIFSPCNVEEALEAFNLLQLSYTPRHNFIKKYNRRHIMKEMAGNILQLL